MGIVIHNRTELCETFLQILPWVNALLRKVLCIMYYVLAIIADM